MRWFVVPLLWIWAVCAAAAQPNMIFVLVDDLRFDGMGFVNPALQTPHIDALAAGGALAASTALAASCCALAASCAIFVLPCGFAVRVAGISAVPLDVGHAVSCA